jgi:hypothetical protein
VGCRILGCSEDLQQCVSMQILYSRRHHKGSHHLRQLLVRYGTYEHTKLGGGGVAEKADVSCVIIGLYRAQRGICEVR